MFLDFTIDMASSYIKKEKEKKQNSKEKKNKQSIFSITEDSIEKYWTCELKTNAI